MSATRNNKVENAKRWIDTDSFDDLAPAGSYAYNLTDSFMSTFPPEVVFSSTSGESTKEYFSSVDISIHKEKKGDKNRDVAQDELRAEILEPNPKGLSQGKFKNKKEKKKKRKENHVITSLSPELSPEGRDSIDEYSESDSDSITNGEHQKISKVKQEKMQENRKKGKYANPDRLATGFALSRKTNYRMSNSTLSPHISPVSQSQLRLMFTPKTML